MLQPMLEISFFPSLSGNDGGSVCDSVSVRNEGIIFNPKKRENERKKEETDKMKLYAPVFFAAFSKDAHTQTTDGTIFEQFFFSSSFAFWRQESRDSGKESEKKKKIKLRNL